MYDSLGLDWNFVYGETSRLLQIYRDVVWSLLDEADNLHAEGLCQTGLKLGQALFFLSDFAPEQYRQRFDTRVTSLFDGRQVIRDIDEAVLRVRHYHENGDVYHRILYMTYLSDRKIGEGEILDALCISRTHYYDQRRDAISLLGIALRPALGGRNAADIQSANIQSANCQSADCLSSDRLSADRECTFSVLT
jgi:hypothetical protein